MSQWPFMLLLLSLLCVFILGGVYGDPYCALAIALWWSLWCFQTLIEIHLLFVSASSVVLSFFSLLALLDPSISPVPFKVSLSVFWWLFASSCVLRSVFSNLWQTCLVIDYPIQSLLDFFGATNSHFLQLPLSNLVLLLFDKYDSSSLSVVCCYYS